ncbi:MAG: hypothetical protein HC923_12520 [Myxococcales bacterium]|nr:hypothetical protein [Myxococcales bacterium]
MLIAMMMLGLGFQGPIEVEMKGVLQTVKDGPSTRAVLKINDDETLVLASRRKDLEEELKNASGATVVIEGHRAKALLPPGVDLIVEDYRILDVGDGQVPRLGQLAVFDAPEGQRLLFVDETGRADLLPESWNKRMMNEVGARLWILGRRDGRTFVPVRFRILRARAERGSE